MRQLSLEKSGPQVSALCLGCLNFGTNTEKMAVMSVSICFVAASDWSASLRTSSATTANPRPCSPALAASMAAFKASRPICPEMVFDHADGNSPDEARTL
ncbi:hypothetical protein D3C74_108600 [compost metagenome]